MQRFGGSFAPPLSDDLIASHKLTIEALPESPTKDALVICHNCVAKWWDLPDSSGSGKPHISGRGLIVDLDKSIAEALWETIPWEKELEMFQQLFDEIDAGSQKELRNLAFHLLWHVKELNLDREPMTNDKL